ncbi:hypothetical protein Brms1b_013505, partial [Colletotrichum noveboracense]
MIKKAWEPRAQKKREEKHVPLLHIARDVDDLNKLMAMVFDDEEVFAHLRNKVFVYTHQQSQLDNKIPNERVALIGEELQHIGKWLQKCEDSISDEANLILVTTAEDVDDKTYYGEWGPYEASLRTQLKTARTSSLPAPAAAYPSADQLQHSKAQKAFKGSRKRGIDDGDLDGID